jgi:hypothetical protein
VRETAAARKRVDNAEAAVRLERKGTEAAENTGLTSSEPENTFHKMMVVVRDSLSDNPGSDDWEDGEAEDDEDTE